MLLVFFFFFIFSKLLKTHLQQLISDIILSDRRYGLMAAPLRLSNFFLKREDLFSFLPNALTSLLHLIWLVSVDLLVSPLRSCIERNRSYHRPDVAKKSDAIFSPA